VGGENPSLFLSPLNLNQAFHNVPKRCHAAGPNVKDLPGMTVPLGKLGSPKGRQAKKQGWADGKEGRKASTPHGGRSDLTRRAGGEGHC